jgi:hypothetical protein
MLNLQLKNFIYTFNVNSTEHNSSYDAESRSFGLEVTRSLWSRGGSLPHSKERAASSFTDAVQFIPQPHTLFISYPL